MMFREKPDIVFLQEVVAESLVVINNKCDSDYHVVHGDDDITLPGMYFTAVLLRNVTTNYKSHEDIPFPTSQMSRSLLKVQVNCASDGLISCKIQVNSYSSCLSYCLALIPLTGGGGVKK